MNILTKYLRQIIKQGVIGFCIIFSALTLVQAQEGTPSNTKTAYVSDDLTIFMHAGPGTNYRILGTINAGAEIQTTGESEKGYSEIIDDKNRVTWIETTYITTKLGLRFMVAELNEKITNSGDYVNQLDGERNELKSTIENLNQDKKNLSSQLKKVQLQLKETQSKVKNQDSKMLTQRFYNGAIVLGVGLLFGLILPRLFARRRNSMDSWS
ncbi:MAG: TIGR04211 family SH3 domain-containing protein [Colwellia sp.]|nr:TIGR04211 family SH3 domain-containing protein [Colwellia sp.]